MIPFEQLYQQQQEISELGEILEHLLSKRELVDNRITAELFDQYTAKVNHHLDMQSQLICSRLLTSKNSDAVKHANRSLEGGREIKRIFTSFIRQWYRKGLRVSDHSTFFNDTVKMIGLVRDRIQSETELLYPLVRRELL
jgi:hypothetical protein